MSFDNLNSENILLYAMKAYDRPDMLLSEFKEDFKRFNYLKRLFRRYRKLGEIKEQLILNHLVVLYNVFGIEPATRLLFLKMSREDHSTLKTFLLFLNYMPEIIMGVNGRNIISTDIPVDMSIANKLRMVNHG